MNLSLIPSAHPRLTAVGSPLVLFMLGVTLSLYSSLRSQLELIPGDLGDTRFNLYLLEHSYRWWTGAVNHLNYWSPPFFYPTQNVMAYSDTLLSIAPLYWLLRILSAEPGTSVVLLLILLQFLNFSAMYLLLRQCFTHRHLPALGGAFLFTFASLRLAHLSHLQLFTQFYSIFAVSFCLRAWKSQKESFLYLQIAAICFGLQCYSSFYLAWMSALLGLLCICSCLICISVKQIKTLSPRLVWSFLGACLTASSLLFPLANEYLQAGASVGYRSKSEVLAFLPPLSALLFHGDAHLLYAHYAPAYALVPASNEFQLGIGILTPLLCLIGLFLLPLRSASRVLTLSACLAILFSSRLSENLSLWFIIQPLLPGAAAIRAPARIHLVILIIWSIGFSALIHYLLERKKAVFCSLVCLFVVALEQMRIPETFSWSEAQKPVDILASAMQDAPTCNSFFYASTGGRLEPWKYHLDTMWAGMQASRIVINGYSGNEPPGWKLQKPIIRSSADRTAIQEALLQWSRINKLNPLRTCWLRPDPQKEKPLRAITLHSLQEH